MGCEQVLPEMLVRDLTTMQCSANVVAMPRRHHPGGLGWWRQ